jgi:lipoprotein Spr
MIRILLLALLISASSSSFAFVKIQAKDWGFNTFSQLSYSEGHFSQALVPNKKAQLKRRIMSEFAVWRGTDYRWGGDSRNGIDCSAFTRRIIASVIHKHLPRTALEQSRMGLRVSQRELAVGDLVFFKTEPNVHHVGVYIGNDSFIHASSSQGVTLSHLSNQYWQEHYLTARRVSA